RERQKRQGLSSFLPPLTRKATFSCRYMRGEDWGLFGFIDDARAALDHLIQLWQTVERLGGPEEQVTTRLQSGVNTVEDVLLYMCGKENQHISAAHHTELTQNRIAFEKILHPELYTTTNCRLEDPAS